MSEKPYHEMTDDELHEEMDRWEEKVKEARGWSSAFYAASRCGAIERILINRGLPRRTVHRIMVGGKDMTTAGLD